MSGGSDEERAERSVTVTLYVQTPVSGARTAAIDRLNGLTAAGAIDGVDVRTVPPRAILSEAGRPGAADAADADEADDAAAALAHLADWERGSLAAAIAVEERRTRLGRTVRSIEPPSITLAVEVDGELACVLPCTDGTETYPPALYLEEEASPEELPEPIGRSLPA